MNTKRYLGLDVGSICLKTAVVGETGEILFEDIRRTHGRPFQAVLESVRECEARLGDANFDGVGVTGTGGQKLAELLGGRFTNEIIAQSVGLAAFAPQVRTAVEMGGQDSKLLLFRHEGPESRPMLRDFSMNSLCAAGTGSFLDQQAANMGVAIEEEFGRLALESKNPPRIAGRCSVFAKSDMIHLQQIATPLCDIAAGLCLALARSFKATVGKGKEFARPVAFLGGVAANAGMVRAFETILGLAQGELLVPPHFRTLGAIGAALRLREAGELPRYLGLSRLEHDLAQAAVQPREGHEPLRAFLPPAESGAQAPPPVRGESNGGRIGVYLGIDVGSMTTKVVAIDKQNRVLSKRYLPTATRPIEAVRRALFEVGGEIADKVEVLGVGSTGSGRVMIGQLVGADVIRNEITAQATAALEIDPEVDTIFEIGGQDSKYISIDHGVVCNFEMNKACAAGTGSFLEEQAERLGVDLESEFNGPVLDAPRPVRLGDRCTVFMESDLVHRQQQGAATRDLLAGLAYSIVHNYLNRVVGDRRVGKRIFFQGGTAFNRAVVAAFNAVLGRRVTVPPHHEVTGAIGAALLARREMTGPTRFRGFDFSKLKYDVSSFTCKSCANQCEIRQVSLAGEKPFYYGSRCEKFEVDRHGQVREDLPDLFAERERLLLGTPAPNPRPRGRVGIPRALLFNEFLPFWRAFFEDLGFEVVLSAPTSAATVTQGVEAVVAEVCLPIKVAHGHLLNLAAQKPDFIFLPLLVDSPTEDSDWRHQTAYNCPWIQSLPYTAASAIDFKGLGIELFRPALHMQRGLGRLAGELGAHRRVLQAGARQIRHALERAQQAQRDFSAAMERRGREILTSVDERHPALVVVGRSYNASDPGMNLNLARKLRTLGVLPIPMDMLPLSQTPLDPHWGRMYWRSGQRILKAASHVRGSRNLFAVYVTNFSCGPDSFLLEFFREEMAGKPHLLLEIDEHSADAGLVTRCEAFLDTLRNIAPDDPRRAPSLNRAAPRQFTNHRRIYLPNMSPQAHPLAAAMRACGLPVRVMDASDEESARLGGCNTSGKECYPCLLTTGDMLRQARRSDFEPGRSAFMMVGSDGPCRLGQYVSLHRRILDKAGLAEVPIFRLEQDRDFSGLEALSGNKFARLACQGIFAVDALEKILLHVRPYETEPGRTDAWFWRGIDRVDASIEQGGSTFWSLLEQLAAEVRAMPPRRGPRRPRVGLVGEMYVRTNVFANDDLVRKVEAQGGEVVLPPWSEWIHYLRYLDAVNMRARGRWPSLLGKLASHAVMLHIKRRIYRIFGLTLEPPPTELFRRAGPYVDPEFEGETVLTIGKSLELILEEGASGIINAMPFTCMPGTVCAALFKRVREENGEFPVLNLAYAGQQAAGTQARLEAFMYQVRQFHEKTGAGRHAGHALVKGG